MNISIKNRLTFIISLSLILSYSHTAYSAPCYGTKMPNRREFFSGLELYDIFKRTLENDNGKIKSLQTFALISYGFFDWFSLDLKVGVGGLEHFDAPTNNIDYRARFDGGYGFRIKLFDKNKIKLVTGFQHISVHPFTTHLNGNKYKAVLDDWQSSILASYNMSFLTPYIGTRLSRLDYITWINNTRKRIMSDDSKSVGLILGLDIDMTDKMWLNLEASAFDSEAFAVSLNGRF